MKQRRKVAILLVVTLVLQMMPLPVGTLAGAMGVFKHAQAAGTSGTVGYGANEISWSVSGTTLTLTGKGNSVMQNFSYGRHETENGSYYECTDAPWHEHYKTVTAVTISGVKEIGAYAFYKFSALSSISGLESVTAMGSYVFAGTALTQVVWPSGLDKISDGAFQQCERITTIAIPAQVRKLGNMAFGWCSSATSITGLDNVTEIGANVFSSCNGLKDITWSEKVPKISDSAFSNCTGLTRITIPDYVTEIGARAFTSCTGVTGTLTIPDNVKTIGDSAFYNCTSTTGGITKLIVGAGVNSIGINAFNNCNRLSSMEWKTVTLNKIGAGAFSETALTKFVVPASVKEIGVNPFVGGSLKEIEVEQGNTKYAVENKMLVTKTAAKKKVISYPCQAGSSAVVPATVKVIGENAFQKARISTVDLPEGVDTMEAYAFALSALRTVKLPKSLPLIGNYAFSNTQSLESVEFQQGLVTIGDAAFSGATALREVHFPGSLLNINLRAFMGATALTTVDGVGGRLQTVESRAFEGCRNLRDVRFGGDLETLGGRAFCSCTSITEITLPDKLRTLGNEVFAKCSKLKKIVFPNSIESVGASALSECSSLESVDFGSIIREIQGNVFYGCVKLAKVTMSENNPNMVAENNVLYNKAKTKIIYYAAGLPDDKFSVPEGVETVGSMAFNFCQHLEELKFPKTVTTMAGSAVCYNNGISKLFFYGNAPKVELYDYRYPYEDDNVWTHYCSNGSIINNKVGSNDYNNKGLIIFTLKSSTGWDTITGWSRSNKTDTGTTRYVWNEQYDLDRDRWDPNKTDESKGTFDSGLKWVYRDDIGEVRFIGEGVVPDFEEGNLFTWTDANADKWLESIGKPKDYMPDVKLVETGGATRMGKNTFKGAPQLYRVLTESSLKEIGESAFADCPKLAIVDVSNVETIEKEAFKNAVAIKDDMDARGVKDIGEGAFSGCNGMTEILLGEGLKSLGKDTFASCSKLETMMLPESTQTLGEGCFGGCSALRTINIPASIRNIPASCFQNCEGLKKVYFYGDCPVNREASVFEGAHEDLVIYCRTANTTWNGVNDWSGIPVEHLDKFYTEKEDHYSFANTGSSFGYGSVYYVPLQRYVTALQSIIRGSFYHAWDAEWGGSCFGMAASSTEFYQGDKFDVNDYSATAENLYDVAAPRDDRADLTKLIEIYQVSQFAVNVSEEIAKNRNEYRKLIKQVEEFERSGGLFTDETADPLVMCLYASCAGHAVVPVAVNMDAEGNYILDVYDSNYPTAFQKIKIRKDFKGINYKGYSTASFVRYSSIRDALLDADFTGQHVVKQDKESDTVAVAVNRENVNLVNGGGRDYSEIEGAYEQKPMSDGKEDEFSGIRSFVLPQGEYVVEEKESTAGSDSQGEAKSAEEDLKYYVATEDLFSEITTSDKDAELTVKSVKGTGYDTVTLSSEKEDTKTDLTVMDVSGIEKEISVTGNSVAVEVNDDSQMELTVSDGAEVTVDGKQLELSDNKAAVSFYAKKGDNPMVADDTLCELHLDEDNKLSGTVQTYLTWKRKQAGNVDIITKLLDEDGNQIAKYTETKRVGLGMQAVNTKLERVSTELARLSGKFNAKCEMTLVDSDGNKLALDPVMLTLQATGDGTEPTATPTTIPTGKPTATPTAAPTGKPTATPTAAPTGKPTAAPTAKPTAAPTAKPTAAPTGKPTAAPTGTPSVTVKPEGTPGPVVSTPTKKPKAVKKSSVPKKGQIKTVGALKYMVMKSSKKNGTVTVYAAKKKNAAKIVIPQKVKINGYAFKVTEIRKNAFLNMKKLSQVTLGVNVKKIGDNAFKNCKKLQSIIIPSKVTAIGKGTFAGCTKLTKMLVKSNQIKSVGNDAFKGITSNMTVKTSKNRWRQYAKMFMGKGKMSHNALFIIDPVKLEIGNKTY